MSASNVRFFPYRIIDGSLRSVYPKGHTPRCKRTVFVRRPHFVDVDQRAIPYSFRLLYRRARQEFDHVD